jgi:hypothetical protein
MMMCISELAIDRLLAGELPLLEATAAREHATRCNRCGGMLDDAVSVQAAFHADPPPLLLPLARRRRFAPYAATAAAAAAVLVLLVARRGSEQTGTHTKGLIAPRLGFFVAHDGSVRRGANGERVVPGDRIELATSSADPGWLTVTSVDGAGVHSVYVPTRAYAAGSDQVLPFAIELDDALGLETVTAMFCPMPGARDCTTETFTLRKEPR